MISKTDQLDLAGVRPELGERNEGGFTRLVFQSEVWVTITSHLSSWERRANAHPDLARFLRGDATNHSIHKSGYLYIWIPDMYISGYLFARILEICLGFSVQE